MKRTPKNGGPALLLACAAFLQPPDASLGQTPPRRVVSLLPAATEVIEALGAGNLLVAVTRHDEIAGHADLPRVGGPADPSLETVAALSPDLVVVWTGVTPDRAVRHLEATGTRVYRARMETLDDVGRTARELGRALGRAAVGDSLARAFAHALDSLRLETGGGRPSVLFVLHPRPPLLTAGPGTYLDEVVHIAGGRNVFGDAPAPWPRVSTEAVIARNPDVVVIPEEDAHVLLVAPWRILESVRWGRVLPVPRSSLLHPGPSSVDLARRLSRFLEQVSAGAGP